VSEVEVQGKPRGFLLTTLIDVGLALLAVAIGLGLSMSMLRSQGFVTVWYGAIPVGIMLLIPRRRWWPYMLIAAAGTFVAYGAGGWPVATSVVRVIADMSIMVALALGLSRWRCIPFRSTKDAGLLVAVALGGGVARALAAAPMVPTQSMGNYSVPVYCANVALTTAIGVLTIVPLVVLVFDRRTWPAFSRTRFLIGVVAICMGEVLITVAFYGGSTSLYLAAAFLIVPIIVLLAARTSQLTLSIGLMLCVISITVATTLGRGVTALAAVDRASVVQATLVVQVFMVSLPLVAWLLAGAVAESVRTRKALSRQLANQVGLTKELERSQELFRTTLYLTTIPMSFGAVDGTHEDVNDAFCEYLGYSREELGEFTWQDHTHPDDIAEEQRLDGLIASGDIDSYRIRKRYMRADGEPLLGDLYVRVATVPSTGERIFIAHAVDVTAEERAKSELQWLAEYDPVTGLRSRTSITTVLQDELVNATLTDGKVAVMFVDLTQFLVVNRTLGYSAGDQVLADIAHKVVAVVPETYVVGRFDGHSLLIVVPDTQVGEPVQEVAEDVLAVIGEETVASGNRISRTGSIGIAYSNYYSTATALIREADSALVAAKAKGRSRYHVQGRLPDPQSPLERLQLEHELRVALDARQFVMHYQPQVRLGDGSVCGYEALVRWNHPSRGLLSPAVFMDTMEASGLVIILGRQVLEQVCEAIRSHPQLLGPISINVSAVEFGDPGWFDRFEATLRTHGVHPESLVVELTETTMLELTDDARAALDGLRAMGIGIHVDDFGTGYASVALLRGVAVTAIKLDRSFVAPLVDESSPGLDLVRGIAGLAAGLGMEAIAEGIETREQAALLLEAGWSIGQGYLFARPSADLSAPVQAVLRSRASG
jgi:diguanylate cyclase (GGDEF)-like protein/PAS domain S-box-containing protein